MAMQKQQRAKFGTPPPVKKGGGAFPSCKGRSGKGVGGK